MKHEMRLHDDPFNKIKQGTKKIEIRLNDEKRKSINIGDTIEFTNRKTSEKMLVKVNGLFKYSNFEELYKNWDKVILGYDEDDIADIIQRFNNRNSKEEQEKYGVLAIKIEKV